MAVRARGSKSTEDAHRGGCALRDELLGLGFDRANRTLLLLEQLCEASHLRISHTPVL